MTDRQKDKPNSLRSTLAIMAATPTRRKRCASARSIAGKPCTGTPLQTRFDVDTWSGEDLLPEIRHALDNGVTADFVLCDETAPDAEVLFSLRRLGHAIVVLDAKGGHIGTFGDLGHAVRAGWTSPWWH